jgi:hypothetical protein
MKYRYGDATPFPLEHNFIDTLCASVDACVAIFHCDTAAADRRARIANLDREMEDELRRLAVLEKAIDAAVAPMGPGDGKSARPYQQAALRIVEGAHGTVRAARAALGKRRETLLRSIQTDEIEQKLLEAMAALLLDFELPKTDWTIRWVASQEPTTPANGSARSVSTCGIAASFDLTPTGIWAQPVAVAAIEPKLELEVEAKGGMLRPGMRTRREPLHKFVITAVEVSPEREAFVLRRHASKPSEGYRVVMRSGEQQTPVVQPLDANGKENGHLLSPSGEAAEGLDRLWAGIEAAMRELCRTRTYMTGAWLGELELGMVSDPGSIAEAILGTMAPFVREMRLRSRVPGELVLKRDLGDGRREELFVPRRELERKFSTLTFAQRACFEAIGLGGESTKEFVTREFPLSAPRSDSEMSDMSGEIDPTNSTGAGTNPIGSRSSPLNADAA